MSQAQRLDVPFSLLMEQRWHVGSGFGTASVDQLVMKRRTGQNHALNAFVPGAQLKGVFRHECECLAATLGFPVVSPHSLNEGSSANLIPGFQPLQASPYLIDRLFGTRYQGECMFVDDAMPVTRNTPTRPFTRTAMDRATGTARQQTLHAMEVTESCGLKLKARLRARHSPGVLTQDGGSLPFEYALLIAGMLQVQALGGMRSSGLGRCTIQIDQLFWNGGELTVEAALKSFEEHDWKLLLDMIREG